MHFYLLFREKQKKNEQNIENYDILTKLTNSTYFINLGGLAQLEQSNITRFKYREAKL